MELKMVATFRAAAATLSFTQAAAALGYVQSSVTAQIQQLERELGVPLFDRVGNRLALTDAGRIFAGYAERLLSLAEEAKAAAGRDAPGGTLSISGPETVVSYLLPAVLARFRKAHGAVRVRYVPVPFCDLKRRVLEGNLDAAFVLEERLAAGTLSVAHLRAEPLALIAAADHALARKRRVTAGDLAGEPVLFTETGCAYRNKFERALIAAGAHPGPLSQEFSSIEAIKKYVAAGLGVAALPRIAVEAERRAGALAVLAWADPAMEVHTQMVWSAMRWMSPALKAFVETVKAQPWETVDGGKGYKGGKRVRAGRSL
jgi:DNA-binding transcriptional LysR family regulator